LNAGRSDVGGGMHVCRVGVVKWWTYRMYCWRDFEGQAVKFRPPYSVIRQ